MRVLIVVAALAAISVAYVGWGISRARRREAVTRALPPEVRALPRSHQEDYLAGQRMARLLERQLNDDMIRCVLPEDMQREAAASVRYFFGPPNKELPQ